MDIKSHFERLEKIDASWNGIDPQEITPTTWYYEYDGYLGCVLEVLEDGSCIDYQYVPEDCFNDANLFARHSRKFATLDAHYDEMVRVSKG